MDDYEIEIEILKDVADIYGKAYDLIFRLLQGNIKLIKPEEMKYFAEIKSNNWRKMHGYPMRKKVCHK